MRIIKPKRLRRGDIIGICAPASPPLSERELNRGIRHLEKLGFKVEIGKNVLRKKGYLAGNDVQRAADINSLFADPKIKAIFTARGGYGSHRILPLLDFDLVKKNPKILVGYSDITALQYALLAKIGLITFSGPMVAAELSGGLNEDVEEQFWNCLMSTQKPKPFKGIKEKSPGLYRHKVTVGRLVGGNLSLTAALIGTPFFPLIDNPIFALEEVNEPLYRIDRMLQHLKLAGILRKAKGIVVGDFSSCVTKRGSTSLDIRQIFIETLCRFKYPVISGFPYGHMKNSLSFPIGIRVRINGAKNSLEFLEAGVI